MLLAKLAPIPSRVRNTTINPMLELELLVSVVKGEVLLAELIHPQQNCKKKPKMTTVFHK
jgi:hypothetical protein